MANPIAITQDHMPLIRVLLVEDARSDAVYLTTVLEASPRSHFVVDHVERLNDALRLIEASRYDVVVLDLSLPDSVGMGTVVILKEADPDLAIVVMTGSSDSVLDQAAIDAGMQEIIVKGNEYRPMLEDTLRHAIARQRGVVKHRKTEHALKRSESSFRALIESCPMAMLVQQDGMLVYLNRVAVEMLGDCNPEEALGKPFLKVFSVGDRVALAELFERVSQDGAPAESTDIRLHGEVERIVDAIAVPIHFGDREAILTVLRDVTEKRHADAKSILSDRVVATSTLAAGMAHEINNPLSYVLADADVALREVGSVVDDLRTLGASPTADPQVLGLASRLAEVIPLLGDCRGGADRIRRIVEDLKILSDGDGDADQFIDVVSVLRSSVALLSREIDSCARLVEVYQTTPWVRANPGRLARVFVNMLTNAIHAMSELEDGAGGLSVSTWTDREDAVIEIQDNGCGMTMETLNRMFDPFYTTKCPGGGRGLGLSISHEIVEGYGGEIEVESALDQGARFRIRLPGG